MGRPKGSTIPIEKRFWQKVDKAGECWLWTGAVMANGYGVVSIAGKNKLVHRVAYELCVGTIPEGFVIDHLCRTRNCVNPDHLEVVTVSANNKRGLKGELRSVPTHCSEGHELTTDNTYIANGTTRVCLTCNRKRNRAQYAKQVGHQPRNYTREKD